MLCVSLQTEHVVRAVDLLEGRDFYGDADLVTKVRLKSFLCIARLLLPSYVL
jgi:hypothetical protein